MKDMIQRADVDKLMERLLPPEDRDDEQKRFDALVKHLMTGGDGGKPITKTKVTR